MSVLWVAAIILAIFGRLLLTRSGPKITGLIVLGLVVLTASSEQDTDLLLSGHAEGRSCGRALRRRATNTLLNGEH